MAPRALLIRVLAALLVVSSVAGAQTAATVRVLRRAPIVERPRGDAALVTTVPLGAVLTVVEERDDWILVEVPVGGVTRRGWITRQLVELSGGPVPAPAAVGTPVTPARASASRSFLAVNGGYQLTANDFSDGAAKRENAEDGRFDTSYAVKGGPVLDIVAGSRVWSSLGLAVGVSRFSVSTPASLTATIPHPFFFNRARSVSGEVTGLRREELAVHGQVRGAWSLGRPLQVAVFGGPSFFQVTQTMIADYAYAEDYPYDEASFRAATTTKTAVTAIGFNVGGDVTVFLTPRLGLGASAQYSGATVDVPGALGSTASVKAGGSRVGAGLRLRF